MNCKLFLTIICLVSSLRDSVVASTCEYSLANENQLYFTQFIVNRKTSTSAWDRKYVEGACNAITQSSCTTDEIVRFLLNVDQAKIAISKAELVEVLDRVKNIRHLNEVFQGRLLSSLAHIAMRLDATVEVSRFVKRVWILDAAVSQFSHRTLAVSLYALVAVGISPTGTFWSKWQLRAMSIIDTFNPDDLKVTLLALNRSYALIDHKLGDAIVARSAELLLAADLSGKSKETYTQTLLPLLFFARIKIPQSFFKVWQPSFNQVLPQVDHRNIARNLLVLVLLAKPIPPMLLTKAVQLFYAGTLELISQFQVYLALQALNQVKVLEVVDLTDFHKKSAEIETHESFFQIDVKDVLEQEVGIKFQSEVYIPAIAKKVDIALGNLIIECDGPWHFISDEYGEKESTQLDIAADRIANRYKYKVLRINHEDWKKPVSRKLFIASVLEFVVSDLFQPEFAANDSVEND